MSGACVGASPAEGGQAPAASDNSAAAIQRRLASSAGSFTHFGCVCLLPYLAYWPSSKASQQQALSLQYAPTGSRLLSCVVLRACPTS